MSSVQSQVKKFFQSNGGPQTALLVAERLGINQSDVEDAIAQLHVQGLLEYISRGTYRAKQPSPPPNTPRPTKPGSVSSRFKRMVADVDKVLKDQHSYLYIDERRILTSFITQLMGGKPLSGKQRKLLWKINRRCEKRRDWKEVPG